MNWCTKFHGNPSIVYIVNIHCIHSCHLALNDSGNVQQILCSAQSYPDEQEGVCLCQQRGQVVLDAHRLVQVFPHLRTVLMHTRSDLLSLPLSDLPQGYHQLLHLDLQV